jgi:hypothetical protein
VTGITKVSHDFEPWWLDQVAWNEGCLLLFIRRALLGDAFECPFLEGLLTE